MDYSHDLNFLKAGSYTHIAGIDEAGRGALAGPLVVAAVILDYWKPILGLNDSKQLSAGARDKLFEEIVDSAIAYSIIELSAARVDEINILQASLEGFVKAFAALNPRADFALIDGRDVPAAMSGKAMAIVKGDGIHPCIAAASILAKVHRDRLLTTLDSRYPEYGFARHKGYGTALHYQALATFGACKEHRRTYRLF
jgi:ribonuclease HII